MINVIFLGFERIRTYYLRLGALNGSIRGQGSPNRVRKVRAAPSAKDFKQ